MEQISKTVKKLVGVDIFLHWRETEKIDVLARQLTGLKQANLKLSSIDSRGLLVWPEATALQENGDHWRCRFTAANDKTIVSEGSNHHVPGGLYSFPIKIVNDLP